MKSPFNENVIVDFKWLEPLFWVNNLKITEIQNNKSHARKPKRSRFDWF